MTPTRFDELPDILVPSEVQQLLRCGRNWAYERIRDGTIPSIKIGRKLLIPKAPLMRWLDFNNPPA